MKKQILLTIFAVWFMAVQGAFAQQQELYTFCVGDNYAYLLDTSATTTSTYYKRWTLASVTGYAAYLQNDTIYQSVKYQLGTVGMGGATGKVRKIRWDGTIVWEYAASSSTTQMHHDLCPMPNGNVLLIVYETKSASPTTVGCSSTLTVWSEKIIEVKPTGSTTGTIVWEWHLWDHLCQSVYPAVTSTYVSSISQHPERMNVNYNMTQDWLHLNGIDYNPALDQIIISSHMMNEVYVIDHSTTTAQAATHTGGHSGKGGDFLYRWGNPATYGCTAGGNNSGFNIIHDAHWISASNPHWPNYFCVYNNNQGGNVQIVLWHPPYDTVGAYIGYTYTPGTVIGPTVCTKPTVPAIFAQDEGNSQQLDNGNILMTRPSLGGGSGAFYESNGINTSAFQQVSVKTSHAYRLKKCQVRYPTASATVSDTTICENTSANLGCSATSITETSPAYTYSWSSAPAGFSSSSQNPMITPTTAGNYLYTVTVTNNVGCTCTASVNVTVTTCTDVEERSNENDRLNIYPNPTTGMIRLNDEFSSVNDFEVIVYNSLGEIIVKGKNLQYVDLSGQNNGIYYLKVLTADHNVINRKVILIK